MRLKDLREVIDIFLKYEPYGYLGGAGHDVVYFSLVKPQSITREDRDRLAALGLHWSNETDGWVLYT